MQKPPTQTYFVCIFYTATLVYMCTYTKAPTHFIMSNSIGTSRRVPKWIFFLLSGLRATVSLLHGYFAVYNNVLYQQKWIIILFWYSYIACRGAISFLIKTNCLSLTSTEFFLQLSDKNKYVLIKISLPPLIFLYTSLGVPYLCMCVSVCVHLKNMKICLWCYMRPKNTFHGMWVVP